MFVAFPLRSVTIDADGRLVEVRVRSDAADSAISRAAVAVRPEDRVVDEGDLVRVERARRVLVQVDGAEVPVDTQAETVAEVLDQAGIEFGPRDTVLYDGVPVGTHSSLEEAPAGAAPNVVTLGRFTPASTAELPDPPAFISVRRPELVTISIDGVERSVESSRVRTDEVLAEAGIALAESDFINPERQALVGSDNLITILREKTIYIVVGGELTIVRTYQRSVADLLADVDVDYREGEDLITPGRDEELRDGMTVAITQVRGETVVIDEAIPYETQYREDPDLPVGAVRVAQPGRAGLLHREYSLDTRDGSVTARELVREWIEPAPQDEIIALGTDARVRTLRTEESLVVPYVDVLNVWATWYNSTCEGCTETTFTNTPLRYGVIAVDPDVIPLGTCLYVPGYGFGRAEDIGGAIQGNRIDLGFPGTADGSWWGARDVEIYILPSCPEQIYDRG
ncbi:MAG: DUF348 domain-containing protein [Dehalococcoidia bacterium]|nr:DUF348 domain-containing protein [Dehalococcoidia bacterium]